MLVSGIGVLGTKADGCWAPAMPQMRNTLGRISVGMQFFIIVLAAFSIKIFVCARIFSMALKNVLH
jgi:hypothetical protein